MRVHVARWEREAVEIEEALAALIAADGLTYLK
jgi:hypothetical protein